MIYQNVRGLRTKLDQLRCSVSTSSAVFDVLIFVETWLCEGIHDSELGLDDYVIYRSDRTHLTSKNLRGGGVLIAVRKSCISRRVDLNISNIEQLVVEIRWNFESFLVGSVYIPPGSDTSVYKSHCASVDKLRSRFTNAVCLLAGDYNMPHTF